MIEGSRDRTHVSAGGPAWQAAIAYGIDGALLEANLRMTPDERLQQLMAMQRLYDSLRPRGRSLEASQPGERRSLEEL